MILQERKRKQKMKKAAIVILTVVLVIAVIVTIALTVFRTRKITVEGNEIYDDATIRNALTTDEYSKYTWYIYAKYNWFQKNRMAFVEDLEVKFDSPSALTVTVYEKPVIGCFYDETTGLYNYFDKDGFVEEQSEELLDETVLVEGIAVESPVLYEKMNMEDSTILSYVLTLTQCLDKYDLTAQKIIVGSYGKVEVCLDDITVNMGKNVLTEEKIMRLAAIISQLAGRHGTINLENFEDDSSAVIFKDADMVIEDASGDATETDTETDGTEAGTESPESTGSESTETDTSASETEDDSVSDAADTAYYDTDDSNTSEYSDESASENSENQNSVPDVVAGQ